MHEMYTRHICGNTANDSKEKKTLGFLIHTWSDKAFKGAVEPIVLFVWKVTGNYAYSPFMGVGEVFFKYIFRGAWHKV